MAAIRLPIELLALNKEFNAKIKASTNNVKKLDQQVKITNESIKKTAQQRTLKNTKTLSQRMSTLGKSYEQSSKQIRIATDKNVSSFKRLEAILGIASKNFRILRNIILPLGLAFFATTRVLRKFSVQTIIAVVKLRIELIKAFILIRRELNLLVKSKSLVEFAANFTRLSERVKRSFDGISDSARNVGDALSDPSLFGDFTSFLGKSAVAGGLATVVFKKLGRTFLGTNEITIALARSSKILGTAMSFGSLKAEIFVGNLAKGQGTTAIIAKLFVRATKRLTLFTTGFIRFGNAAERSGSILVGLNNTGLRPFSKFLRDSTRNSVQFGKGITEAAKQTKLFSKGLFGSVSRISAFGVGILGLSLLLKQSENAFIRFLGSVGEFVGLLLGPVNILVSRIITAVGGFIQQVGTNMVNANLAAAASFQKVELNAFIFERTINAFGQVFPTVVGNTQDWNVEIERLNKTTGEAVGNLRFVVTELVAAGSEMGITNKQMKLLTSASVDFAAQIKGDSKQAVIDLISALNGNSQSVIKYGLQLSAASVQQKLFDKGIKVLFKDMTAQQKVQARLIAITSKYKIVSGLAAEQTQTFEGTTKLFNTSLAALVSTYGEGANVVENFSVVQNLSIAAIENLNPLLVKTVGFFGAIAARVIQVTGFVLKLSFTFALLSTSFKAVNTLLGSQTFQRGLFAKLPFINGSFATLVKSLGVTNLKLKSLGDVMRTVGTIFFIQTRRMIAGILGVDAATLTMRSGLKVLGKRVLILGGQLLVLATNPIVLTLIGLAIAAKVLVEAFKVIDKETGLVTKAFNSIKKVFEPIIKLFTEGSVIMDAFKDVFNVVLGALVSVATRTFAGLSLLISTLPDFVIAADKKIKFRNAGKELNELSDRITNAGFDLRKLGKEADLASKAGDDFDFGLAKLSKELQKLQDDLSKASQTELQRLRATRDERLAIITAEFKDELTLSFAAAKLKQEVEAVFRRDREALELKHRLKLAGIAAQFGGIEATRLLKEQELTVLLEAFQAELLSREQFEQAKLVIEQKFNDQRLSGIINVEQKINNEKNRSRLQNLKAEEKILRAQLTNAELGARERARIEARLTANQKAQNSIRLGQASQFFGDLSSLTSSKNKSLFAIGKVAALANATIQGFVAVQNALAVQPFPVGVALAAAAAIRAAVQIDGISRQSLQTGITQVPPGFNNDTFAANLSSGERVISTTQNRDLTAFLANRQNGGSDQETKDILKSGFESVVEKIEDMTERLDNLENEFTVNIGNKEIVREVRDGLRSGRSLAI